MRPPRLILLLLCLIFLPILFTALSLLTAHPHDATTQASNVHTTRLRALFSFHAPSALFPPSAIISLTDDNSTFFLARPAAFGPLLPSKGLSGPLWIGTGFSDDALRAGDTTIGAEGELGCSDVPGWEDGNKNKNPKPGSGAGGESVRDPKADGKNEEDVKEHQKRDKGRSSHKDTDFGPTEDDGTDDHLHHSFRQSDSSDSNRDQIGGDKTRTSTHADIQSLQESAEISGKVVLLTRGGCGFLEKVKWVQRRGGSALIVGDDTRGGGLVTMYARGDTSNVSIPAVFTSYTTAHLLSSLVPEDNSDNSKTTLSKGKQKQKAKPTLTNSGAKSTSTDAESASPSPGFFHLLLGTLGLGNGRAHEDANRPPSSGNLDWSPSNQQERDAKLPQTTHSTDTQKPTYTPVPQSPKAVETPPVANDDFVIGVQDWRDPDLVPPLKSSSTIRPSSTATPGSKGHGSNDQKSPDSGTNMESNWPRGGSITPGSGEYANQDKLPKEKDDSSDSGPQSKGGNENHDSHWWPKHFGWGGSLPATADPEDKMGKPRKGAIAHTKEPSSDGDKKIQHEGLWVTLTPTNMSTSPFFDTLLVLVVSPLITLTVVYALLLLRSRIRRRRWRAPKAVVDRLPVRTYHTMSTSSSPRSITPGSASPTSPLLSHSRPHSPRPPRPRSQTCSGPVSTSSNSLDPERPLAGTEKSRSGSTVWRRKYTGRQVECVVCLEEYVDGQSRVMSLPCGHEFHAECITPWLTTRRRTCPICKGDVVRSMHASSSRRPERSDPTSEDAQAHIAETRNDSPSSSIPLSESTDDMDSDLERGPSTPLLGGSDRSQTQSTWRNFAMSALSGDSMWHQPRRTGSHRDR